MNCININDKNFKQLLEETKLPSLMLEMRIAKWQEANGVEKFPTASEIINSNEVNMSLKAVEILSSDKAVEVFNKGKKNNWDLNKILTELQIPKEQKQLILDSDNTTIEDIITDLLANYSYTVEVNTAIESVRAGTKEIEYDSSERFYSEITGKEYYYSEELGWLSEGQEVENLPEDATPLKEKRIDDNYESLPTQIYSQRTVPGGIHYTENEIATPAITPSIKGHAQFATDKGIGWFRSDDKTVDELKGNWIKNESELPNEFIYSGERYFKESGEWQTKSKFIEDIETVIWRYNMSLGNERIQNKPQDKTRRILEVQSDLFQKSRDKEDLTQTSATIIDGSGKKPDNIYVFEHSDGTFSVESDFAGEIEGGFKTRQEAQNWINGGNKNQFLQLLNKNNNWVTFFVKSIIQDSAKKGYEKVLFPTGDTASKVEGHATLEKFKKEKEDRIKELEKEKKNLKDDFEYDAEGNILGNHSEYRKKDIEQETTQLKQELERVEKEGFAALAPIFKFYEQTITNILNKQYGKDNVKKITDEYGNTWNELTLEETRDTSTIFMKEKTFEEKMQELVDPNAENILHLNEVEENKNEENTEYGEINKEILFSGTQKQVYTADEILQNILSNNLTGLTEHGKFFLEKAAKVLAKTNATVRIRSDKWMRLNGSKDAIMTFDSQSNTINISLEILNQITPELAVEAFIHEVVHSATVKAYIDPKTFEERSFKKFIDEAYAKYKGLSELVDPNTGKIYGFRNQIEFISEAYTNPEFQNILRGLDPEVTSVEKGFWSKLVDAIRRLFGLTKSVQNDGVIDFSLVNRKLDQMIEQGNPNWRGTIVNDLRYDIFEKQATKKEVYRKYDSLETIEQKLEYVLNKIKDNLDQNIGKYEKIKASIKKDDPRRKKLSGYVDVLKSLQKKLKQFDDTQSWLAISTYTKNLVSSISILDSRFQGEDFSNKNILSTIKLYSQYLDSYAVIEDVAQLLSDSFSEQVDNLTEEDRQEIRTNLESAQGKYTLLRRDFNAFLKKGIKKDLAHIKNVPEVETKWKERLTKEYDENKESLGITESKVEWISKQMNTVHKDAIQKDVEAEVNKIIESVGYDIQSGTYYFSSALNTNSKLVQIFQFILDEIRAKITDMVTTKDVQFEKLFNKLVKEKGSTDVLKLYKNIIEYDGDTPILKGEYSIKYRQRHIELTEKLDELSDTVGRESIEYKRTLADLNNLKREDFKNDLSGLSKTELEVLNFFKGLIDETSKMTYNIQSLKKFDNDVVYYKLPVVTKSDLERILQGDMTGIVKDKWKDLTEIRPDEEGYEYANVENIDMAGNPMYNIRILYRGNIPGKDQSLDLFTIMRMEYLNAVNFQVKTEREMELNALVEIAKDKKFYRTTGMRSRILSRFSTRNRASTIKGSESNTYKKMKSMMEMNIYNMMRHNASKWGQVDVNKAVSFLNAWLAHAGLDMNRHAATANVLNAQANVFLETISGQVIKGRDVRRANAVYTNDLSNILKDVSNPIPRSFTNQTMLMFDTFGYRDIGGNAFIRKGVGKALINTDRGQIMHTSGEHWVQSTLTMAVLNNIKVMNENSQFINKQGEVVEEKKAASVLDMLELNSNDGKIQMNPKAVYTTHTLNVKFNEGGREQISELVKKKILDSNGNYDPNMQPEIMRHWWGKLIMIFRRFFVPMFTQRYKGFEHSRKSKEELAKEPEKYLSYSHSLKQYEEGTYTTLVRFITHSIIPAIKQRSFKTMSSDYKNLSDFEKGNMRKAMTEIALTAMILPLIRSLLGALLGGAGDDEGMNGVIYFWLYQTRRLESELAQFRNINEQFKILRSPIPSARLLEQSSTLLYKIISPFEWQNLNDKYETGRKKGDLKIRHDFQKLIPILNKIEINSKELFEYQDAAFGR
jgi:hypothetical protein